MLLVWSWEDSRQAKRKLDAPRWSMDGNICSYMGLWVTTAGAPKGHLGGSLTWSQKAGRWATWDTVAFHLATLNGETAGGSACLEGPRLCGSPQSSGDTWPDTPSLTARRLGISHQSCPAVAVRGAVCRPPSLYFIPGPACPLLF